VDNGSRLIMPAINGAIEFRNVSFRYKPSSPLLLRGVNLTIPTGCFVAVVGTSGSGKSTLTKLLARLYAPEDGTVLIDGIDIAKVELYSLRRQVGIVPQDTVLFDGSVEENITLTQPEASSEEVIEAAENPLAGYDILFRMLEPHELAAAMGFDGEAGAYQFAGTKTDQIKQIGNAVSVAKMRACVAALILANRL
jgi:ABC-type bacteriocin/lantibiotic exporter with double-glycine peptidase domain